MQAGDELARLDTTEVEARRAQAAASVEVAKAQLAELEAGPRREEVASAKSALAGAEQQVADARPRRRAGAHPAGRPGDQPRSGRQGRAGAEPGRDPARPGQGSLAAGRKRRPRGAPPDRAGRRSARPAPRSARPTPCSPSCASRRLLPGW